ncbi:Nucleolar complex protein 3-like protein [Acropora cervicornis]|uniref:NOC3-like protein n=1 Tax=Acropora cervicornis TaxID=6130 RepID=A0AAD9QMD4_ACRCE|nr:Nucleolar complex protein 3-like protein [Acropora cervicornis]
MARKKRPKETKKVRKAVNDKMKNGDVEIPEEDVLDPEDFEYFQDMGNSAFIQGIAIGMPAIGNKRKRKPGVGVEDAEADYEKKPRVGPTVENPTERILLPIKSANNIIQRKEKIIPKEPENVQQTTISPTPPPMISMVELFSQRQEKLEKRRLRIAGLSNRILENPQEHIPELQELCRLCDEKDVDVEITTRKLAMVSLYPIRVPTQKERAVKLSKDVKKLRDFEDEGLKLQTAKVSNGLLQKKVASQGLIMVAVQCMCDLLTSLPHFNFHTNLVAVLVPRMNDKHLDGQISKQCFDAFVKLFKQDSLGKVSLEAVKFISKFVKRKQFRVQPCVLETFLHLRINPLVIQALKKSNEKKSVVELKLEKKKHRIEKKLKGKMSKKEKKRRREMKKLENELKETEAVESHQKKAKLQTEILKFVFVTYFRVLKTIGHCPLLSPVLEGLAKFAHLINIEFFNDLMAAIQSLLNNENLTLRETLNCEALNIDPRGFYNMLYSCLLQVDAGSNSQDAFIVLQCLEEMLKKRRKQRVSGFVKRLCTVSLHSQANGALAFLSYVKSFLQSHTKVHALLDNESIGIGLFRPDVNDPELSNADSSTAWELALLRTAHYHPLVKMIAHHVAQGAPSKGHFSAIMRKSAEALWQEYDSSEMKLNPDMDENTPMNNKKVLFKKVRHMSAGGWKIADMESDVINALDFTERRGSSAKFTLAVRQAAR